MFKTAVASEAKGEVWPIKPLYYIFIAILMLCLVIFEDDKMIMSLGEINPFER